MTTKKKIDMNEPLTDAQIAMLKALEARPDEPDADCPELTEAQLSQFRRVRETTGLNFCSCCDTIRSLSQKTARP